MPLPIDFQFSQNNLQDYLDCPRRFELRFVLKQQWPALPSEPVKEREHHMEAGNRLHAMIHQHFTGIPDDLIEAQVDDSQLLSWWRTFLANSPIPKNILLKRSEFLLSGRINPFTLVAKYDLVILTSDLQAWIFDWKTNLKHPSGKSMREKVQSRLYPYLLASVMRFPQGDRITPAQVKMVYWFVNYPNEPEVLAYTQAQSDQDQTFLTEIINQIHQTAPGHFIMTQNERICAFCTYRSLCNRGIKAGDWNQSPGEDESGESLSINFEQIGEIEF